MLKKISILIISLIMITTLGINKKVYADNSEIIDAGEQDATVQESTTYDTSKGYPSNLGDFKPEVTTNEKADGIIGKLLGALQVVGGIMIVLGIAYIGFMTILGSAEEKASYKGKAVGIVIAAVMIFLGSTIARFVISVV